MQNNKTSVGTDAILALAQSLAASKQCFIIHVTRTDGTKGEHGVEKEAAAAQYSRAINLLHSNLTSDECRDDLNNLAAIVLFYYYEVSPDSIFLWEIAERHIDDFGYSHRWLVVPCGRNGSPGRVKRAGRFSEWIC